VAVTAENVAIVPERKTYSGGCHCGKVRYEVTTDLAKTMMCNCSICSKKGALMTFVGGEDFRLLKGEADLSDYQFNKKHIHHVFCSTCGIGSFANGKSATGKTMYSVNVRCLDDVDPASFTPAMFDGKKL
jgi:hypothetical protein